MPSAPPVEAGKGMRESLVCQGGHFVVTCLVEKLFHLLLPNGEPAEPELHTFHGQRKQHQQHWEEDHSETLHTG